VIFRVNKLIYQRAITVTGYSPFEFCQDTSDPLVPWLGSQAPWAGKMRAFRLRAHAGAGRSGPLKTWGFAMQNADFADFTFTNSDLTMIYTPKLDLHRNQEPLKRYLDELRNKDSGNLSCLFQTDMPTQTIKHHRSKHQTWGLDFRFNHENVGCNHQTMGLNIDES